MISHQLLKPESIAVIGASNDISKPGGKILKNILDGKFSGDIYVVNHKEDLVQGIKSYSAVSDLPDVDMAVIAIAAKYCPETVEVLALQKKTRAFIIISAGFSEESEEGAKLEKRIVDIINQVGGTLIGPNCIGVLTPHYQGIFTEPIPKLDHNGIDFISGSGATAVFILNAGIPLGVTFASLYSVGNSAQIGIEEILKHLDETYVHGSSPRIKMLYMEKIDKPESLLKHASSLINKGARIVAIKAGSSEAGSRAASSHTGALASSDLATDALFKKAGIIRAFGREELVTIAALLCHKELKGKNIAVVTHAGGPAVMMTDALSKAGLHVPAIDHQLGEELLEKLFPGSAAGNPIDFLATGTAEQLGNIIDFVENRLDFIDGMAIIYGKPGLFDTFDAFEVIDKKMKTCKKPIFTIFPTTIIAQEEIDYFKSLGRIIFLEEVVCAESLAKIYFTPKPADEKIELPKVDVEKIRGIIRQATSGYTQPWEVSALLDAANIPRAGEETVTNTDEALKAAEMLKFPVVMKVVGPVHKSESGGVILNITNLQEVRQTFENLMKIKSATGVLIQPMLKGTEIFIGAKKEERFGHLILCGLGGIFIEILKDVASGLAPLTFDEALSMIRSLKSYKIIQGARGKEGVNENMFAETIVKLGALLKYAPEISEMDINPLLGTSNNIVAVDARILIEK